MYLNKYLTPSESLLPMRHTLGIAYNISSALRMPVDLALGLLSEKLRSRVRHVSDLESCPEIEKSSLPIEMGGDRFTTEQMIGMWKQEMSQSEHIRKLVEQNNEMHVNMQLFTKREMEGEFNASDNKPFVDLWGGMHTSVAGSFRKLEVD